MGAALRRLLASLAAHPDRMSEFIRHPMDVLEDADLSESERQAIVSRDQSQIQLSIMEDWTGAPDPADSADVAQDLSAATVETPGNGNRRGQLVVVGTGLRTTGHFTSEAIAWIRAADKVLYVVGDPVAEEVLRTLNPDAVESLQDLYGEGKERQDTYDQMVERILECVRSGLRTCAAFYGHPGVFVYPSHVAVRRARAEGFSAIMLPGISAEDCLFADLGIDPAAYGCQSYEATDYLFSQRRLEPSSALVLWQVGVVGSTTFTSGEYRPISPPAARREVERNLPATPPCLRVRSRSADRVSATGRAVPPRPARCHADVRRDDAVRAAGSSGRPRLSLSGRGGPGVSAVGSVVVAESRAISG